MVRVEEGEGAAGGVGRAPLEAWLLRIRNVGMRLSRAALRLQEGAGLKVLH